MPVLIDGNNLLFAAQDTGDPDRLIGRSALCAALGVWSQRTNERVHVVFDGAAPAAGLARQISHEAIRVTYSGGGISADDVIIRLIDEDSAARRLIVVSSDRAIRRAARRRGGKSLRSDAFWAQVQRDLTRPERPPPIEPPQKRTGLLPDEVDGWLERFDRAGSADDE